MSARCRDQRSAAVRGNSRLVQDLAQLEAQLEPTGMLTRREKTQAALAEDHLQDDRTKLNLKSRVWGTLPLFDES